MNVHSNTSMFVLVTREWGILMTLGSLQEGFLQIIRELDQPLSRSDCRLRRENRAVRIRWTFRIRDSRWITEGKSISLEECCLIGSCLFLKRLQTSNSSSGFSDVRYLTWTPNFEMTPKVFQNIHLFWQNFSSFQAEGFEWSDLWFQRDSLLWVPQLASHLTFKECWTHTNTTNLFIK